jgi:hypothetical protein
LNLEVSGVAMKNILLVLLVATVLGVSVPNAVAQTIDGPTLNLADSGYQYSGIGFTANVNSF